jgi:heat shock protein HtpX
MNQLKTLSLLALLSALLISASYFLIGGPAGIIIGVVVAAVTNIGSWYFSDRIALAAYRAQPLNPQEAPQLYAMVQRLCDRAGMPMPKLFVVPTSAANAFATGRDPQHAAVAVTQGIVELLQEDELEAVIAHELSHVRSRDTLTPLLS